jgi:hypothetical protein
MMTFIKTLIGLTIIMTIWIVVQFFWKKFFLESTSMSEDALMERGGCTGCGCTNVCVKK